MLWCLNCCLWWYLNIMQALTLSRNIMHGLTLALEKMNKSYRALILKLKLNGSRSLKSTRTSPSSILANKEK